MEANRSAREQLRELAACSSGDPLVTAYCTLIKGVILGEGRHSSMHTHTKQRVEQYVREPTAFECQNTIGDKTIAYLTFSPGELF